MLDHAERRHVLSAKHLRGFGYAMPLFTETIARAHMRSTAEALQNAIRVAQEEAIRRNRQVVFALTNTSPAALNSPAVANGKYWFTQSLKLFATEAAAESYFLSSDTTAAANGVSLTGPAAICFNSVGRMVATPAASTGVNVACTTPGNAVTPFMYDAKIGTYSAMRVQIYLGGRVRMCNAAKVYSAAVPDGC
jgi:type IV fimbrial biogenesis protein FimT